MAGPPEPPKPPRPSQAPPASPLQPPKPQLRPSRTLPSGKAPGPVDADEAEKLAAIRDLVDHAVAFEQAVATAKPIESWRSRPLVLAALAVPCLALYLYTAFARPVWVYGPDPAKVAPAQREAHLRFAIFLMAQRIDAYRAATGALPGTLLEAGEDWREINYQEVDESSFELRAVADSAHPIVFRSSDDPAVFLGGSRRLLRELRP